MVYDALRSILVGDNKPLPNLFMLRLPPKQNNNSGVDCSLIPRGGFGEERRFGESNITATEFQGRSGGTPTDGGVLWWKSDFLLHFRAANNQSSLVREAVKIMNDAISCLAQYKEPVTIGDETIYRITTTRPDYIYDDANGRPVIGCYINVWHRGG